MFWELKMCLWTIHQVMKGEINGLVAHVHVIVMLSIQVVFLFALKCVFGTLLNTFTTCCERWVDSRLTAVVSPNHSYLYALCSLSENSSKQTYQINWIEDEIVFLKAARLYSAGQWHNSMCLSGQDLFIHEEIAISLHVFFLKLSWIKLS